MLSHGETCGKIELQVKPTSIANSYIWKNLYVTCQLGHMSKRSD